MRDLLRNCIDLCAHAANDAGLAFLLPAGWVTEGTDFSLDLEVPYETRISLYVNDGLKKAVLVCWAKELSAINSPGLLNQYRHLFINRFKNLEIILKALEDTFSDKLKGKVYVFTGFGVAGWLAQLCAYSFNVHCFSLDSPGNKTLLEAAFKRDKDLGTLESRSHHLLHVFLTLPNPLNTSDNQLADLYRIKMPIVQRTSLKHVAFAVLDIASVGSSFLLMGQIFKVLMAHLDLEAASTTLASQKERENPLKSSSINQPHFPLASGLLGLPLSTIQSNSQAARKNLNTAQFAKDLAIKRLLIIGAGLVVLQLTKRWDTMIKHSIQDMHAFFCSAKVEIAVFVKPMRSWPRTTDVSTPTWKEFFIGFVWPKKGIYLHDENAYLEASRIRILSGYVEEDDSTRFEQFDVGNSVARSGMSAVAFKLPALIDLSNSSLTARALNCLLCHIALCPDRYSTLTELNLSNNVLDDDAVHMLLSPTLNCLIQMDLSKNRLTFFGFWELVKTFIEHSTLTKLDLSENSIFLDYDSVKKIRDIPKGKNIDLGGNILKLELEIGAGLSYDERQQRNREIVPILQRCRFTLFPKSDSVKSIFPWVSSDTPITARQTLIIALANKQWIHQHALLLIERLNEHYLKEIVIYELFFNEKDKKAFVSCTYPTISHPIDLEERFQKIIKGEHYKWRYEVISQDLERDLVDHLNSDVRQGCTFNYHRFASRGSDGVERTNCAKWLADHFRAIGLTADLGWLNLPSDLIDGRGWLSKLLGP